MFMLICFFTDLWFFSWIISFSINQESNGCGPKNTTCPLDQRIITCGSIREDKRVGLLVLVRFYFIDKEINYDP